MSEPVGPLARLPRQPDRFSCGASVLVAAHMLADPAYAAMAGGRFGLEVLAMHRRVTGPVDVRGRLQLPWPRALGTPPWAVARQLSAIRRPGLPAVPYVTRLAFADPGAAHDQALAAVRSGRPVALYVGDHRLPRHVTLAVDTRAEHLLVYEPSSGRLLTTARAAAVDHRLALGRWDRLWFVVRPR